MVIELMFHILVKLPKNKFDNDKYGIGGFSEIGIMAKATLLDFKY